MTIGDDGGGISSLSLGGNLVSIVRWLVDAFWFLEDEEDKEEHSKKKRNVSVAVVSLFSLYYELPAFDVLVFCKGTMSFSLSL